MSMYSQAPKSQNIKEELIKRIDDRGSPSIEQLLAFAEEESVSKPQELAARLERGTTTLYYWVTEQRFPEIGKLHQIGRALALNCYQQDILFYSWILNSFL